LFLADARVNTNVKGNGQGHPRRLPPAPYLLAVVVGAGATLVARTGTGEFWSLRECERDGPGFARRGICLIASVSWV
jgi:hypothetical protein